MEKRYIIGESELKELVKARAILDVFRQSDTYAECNYEYLQTCIKDFGCNNIDEVAEKLIEEFEYEIIEYKEF